MLMNTKDKEYIMDRVRKHYDYLLTIYPSERIVGVFAYGSANYGTWQMGVSDVDTKAIILPSMEDLFTKTSHWISIEHHIDDEHCEAKDIRLMNECLLKQNMNFLEILFTEFKILNKDYESIFRHYYWAHRDIISHYDIRKAFMSMYGQTLGTIKQIKEHDYKKTYNICRMILSMQNYLNGEDYENCLYLGDDIVKSLIQIKNGKGISDLNKVVALQSDMLNLMRDSFEKTERNFKPSGEYPLHFINEGTVEIFKAYLGMKG